LHFFFLSLGGGGFRGKYFSVFSGSHYVDIPPSAHFGWGPQGKGGGASSQS